MRIEVQVKASARKEEVQARPDGSLKIYVREVPDRGKANARVVELLAEYFDVSKIRVRIVRGAYIQYKIIDII